MITDEITQEYQTEKWAKPAQMTLQKIAEKDGVATLEVKMFDSKNVLCLDANNLVSFSLIGDGELIRDQGTSTGSAKVQLYNGRAIISVKTNNAKSTVAVQSKGISTVFLGL